MYRQIQISSIFNKNFFRYTHDVARDLCVRRLHNNIVRENGFLWLFLSIWRLTICDYVLEGRLNETIKCRGASLRKFFEVLRVNFRLSRSRYNGRFKEVIFIYHAVFCVYVFRLKASFGACSSRRFATTGDEDERKLLSFRDRGNTLVLG